MADNWRRVLAQGKQQQPKEYFVYFEVAIVKNWGKRTAKDRQFSSKVHQTKKPHIGFDVRVYRILIYRCRRIWHLEKIRLPGFIGPFPPPLLIRLICSSVIFYPFFSDCQVLSTKIFTIPLWTFPASGGIISSLCKGCDLLEKTAKPF